MDVYLALLDFRYMMCCKIPMTESTAGDGGNVLRVLGGQVVLLWLAGRGLVAVVEGDSL